MFDFLIFQDDCKASINLFPYLLNIVNKHPPNLTTSGKQGHAAHFVAPVSFTPHKGGINKRNAPIHPLTYYPIHPQM